jgi:hypothetical protein
MKKETKRKLLKLLFYLLALICGGICAYLIGFDSDKIFPLKSDKFKDAIHFTWQVNEGDNTKNFAIKNDTRRKFSVNWGDGSTEKIERTDTDSIQTITHTYSNAGSYIVTIGGTSGCLFTSFLFCAKDTQNQKLMK